MGSLPENDGAPNSDVQPNKRRRKKSIVWEHFTIETVDADCTRACCNQCKKSFAYISGSKLAGTSHLRRHITLGICPVSKHNLDKDQVALAPDAKINGSAEATVRPRRRFRATPGCATMSFDQEHCNHEIAKMIIQHDYSLRMVEDSGFIDFARALQPQYNSVGSNTIQEHISRIHSREKQNLLSLLAGSPGRICLSLDLWTSDQSLGYVILTGQFVDCDWKLHRRILNVVMLPYPDSEVAFNQAVAACLTDWSLDNKLFTLTLNESFSTENVRGNLRGLLSCNNKLVFNGQLIIGSCYARALSGVAQEALASMSKTIHKVRQSVKYVVTSRIHQEKFNDLKQKLQVPSSRSLAIDDLTNWSTAYEMLTSAFELREVFPCLGISDPEYRITPSVEEWCQVETLCRYLKLLYDAASILTTETYPTANMFFHEAYKIQLELMHAVLSQDIFVSNLTRPLWEKFNRYWNDCNIILAVAAVMDPRFKMKLIEFSFPKIYGEDAKTWIGVVEEGLHDLFLEYVVQTLPPPIFMEEAASDSIVKSEISTEEDLLSTADDAFTEFDIYVSGIENYPHTRSYMELDAYLQEDLLPRVQEFDALGWWRLNRSRYPILSKMAVDILCIPVSTVSAESIFDTSNKKMDSSKSNLRPATLEALICSKDWMQYKTPEFIPEEFSSPLAVVKTEL
ncbi:hypothetical protein M9H77_29265 [Catharanthus roseus]|uniref:Uncharacterized protein n=1 Tax=Catharanthus roseus TaxID=4058 RepID=A0ACC0AJ49_CATRO|nr:hypothetical protein M9H77_29265 [Catharanthus roseus]